MRLGGRLPSKGEKKQKMAPKNKKACHGLQRVNGEWVNDALVFGTLPADWSAHEAAANPEPWVSSCALLHALRRLAILADPAACKLLLSLHGQDIAKEQQIRAKVGADPAATRASEAISVARSRAEEPSPEEPAPRCATSAVHPS